MRILIILLGVTILLSCGACEKFADSASSIRVYNKSSQSITAYANYILPDTSLSSQKPEKLIIITAGKFKDIYDHYVGDEDFKRLENERITIFVLSTDTINKYPWDTI